MRLIIESQWYRVVFKDENKVVTIFSGSGYFSNCKEIDKFVKCISKPNVTKVHLIFDGFYLIHGKTDELSIFKDRLVKLLRTIYTNKPNVKVFIHMSKYMKPALSDIEHKGYVIRRGDARFMPKVYTDWYNIFWFRIGNNRNKCRFLSITPRVKDIIVDDNILFDEAKEKSKGGVNE